MTLSEPRGWINSDSWLEPVSECTWWGITCDDDGKVANIDLVSTLIHNVLLYCVCSVFSSATLTRVHLLLEAFESFDWIISN